MTKISVNPDHLEELANDFVLHLSRIEQEYKDLHMELFNLINSAPAEYRHCFAHVGDPWGTGNRLSSLLSEMEIDLRMTANKLSDADNLVGKLYKLHERYGSITALGALATKQLTYYGLGFTQFTKNSAGSFTYKHMSTLHQISDAIDNSKLRTPARALLNPTYLTAKYKNASFADLVHKKVAKYLPGDVVNFTESTRGMFEAFKRGAIDQTMFKSFVQTGSKFARTNAVSTVLVTGAMEVGGMGLKISENYAKYGDNTEILKRENAKAVGNAVNKTVAVSGGAIAGAVVGGVLGSFFGPIGTVVLGSIGSFVGGFIGEKVSQFTAGVSEKLAIAFKEPIHHGIEVFKSGFEKVGEVVELANKGIDLVNDQIKETISDPVGKVKEIEKGITKAKETANSLIEGAKNYVSGKLSFL